MQKKKGKNKFTLKYNNRGLCEFLEYFRIVDKVLSKARLPLRALIHFGARFPCPYEVSAGKGGKGPIPLCSTFSDSVDTWSLKITSNYPFPPPSSV